MNLSICIVNYKSRDELAGCLDSLRKNPPSASFEIIVVDNNSQDGTNEMITRDYPDIWLIQNQKNQGFGRACNKAIKQAKGDYILLLNPDTQVGERSIDNLLLVSKSVPGIGTLGANLFYPDGTYQPSNYKYFPGIFNELGKIFFLEKISERKARTSPLTRVAWSCGAAILFKRKLGGELVLLDPNIFLYSEDIELCWRLRKMGYHNYVTNTAVITHAHNKSGEKVFGSKASHRRLQAFKNTLHYVYRRHARGLLKEQRFKIFSILVALNSYWRSFLIPTLAALQGKKLDGQQKKKRLAIHKATALVFSAKSRDKYGLWQTE